jgi:hypothetical protein
MVVLGNDIVFDLENRFRHLIPSWRAWHCFNERSHPHLIHFDGNMLPIAAIVKTDFGCNWRLSESVASEKPYLRNLGEFAHANMLGWRRDVKSKVLVFVGGICVLIG